MDRYSSVVDDLRALPPRFHLDLEPASDARTLAEIMADPLLLTEWMRADAAAVGAAEGQVAASMLVQHTAMLLGGITLGAALLGGVLPIVKPEAIHVAPGGATRWRFAFADPHFETGDDEALLLTWAAHWVDGIFMELVDAIRGTVRVGHRMLRDNVVTAAGSSLVFLDWWAPERGFGALVPVLEGAGDPAFGESITLSHIEHGGHLGLRSVRRSCCLHSQTEPPHWCPTCPKLEDQEREQIMRTHLGHLDAIRSGEAIRPTTN